MADRQTNEPRDSTKQDNRTDEQRKRERNVLGAFWATQLGGLFAVLLFSFSAPTTWAGGFKLFAIGMLVTGAAAIVGALFGFLFGLPRSFDDVDQPNADAGQPEASADQGTASAPPKAVETSALRRSARSNNNLLEISDWLTKVIVGAGLVGLKDITRWLGDVGQTIGTGAGLHPEEGRVFGASVILFFFGWGFLFVYIQTRTIISLIFQATERSLTDAVREAVGGSVKDAVSAEVRQSVVPALTNASVGTIMQLLYSAPKAAEQQARAFLADPENASNALARLYLACALGQQHEKSTDAAERQKFRDQAYDALKRALTLDPALKPQARGFMYPDEPGHLDGDDDLTSFREDKDFVDLLGPPTPPRNPPAPQL